MVCGRTPDFSSDSRLLHLTREILKSVGVVIDGIFTPTITPNLRGVQWPVRKLETILAHLERELDEKMLEAPTQSNLVGANLLLENMGRQLDQAIIFDKTIRVHLEKELEALRGIMDGSNASASQARERLKDFRSFYQDSFANGQIV
jgi:hypothetical protein